MSPPWNRHCERRQWQQPQFIFFSVSSFWVPGSHLSAPLCCSGEGRERAAVECDCFCVSSLRNVYLEQEASCAEQNLALFFSLTKLPEYGILVSH